MSGQITPRLKPEEEELRRKGEELAAIRTSLAEREVELVDLRDQLAAFEGRYLRQVGTLYAELDERKARIAELRARLNPAHCCQNDSRADCRGAKASARVEAALTVPKELMRHANIQTTMNISGKTRLTARLSRWS